MKNSTIEQWKKKDIKELMWYSAMTDEISSKMLVGAFVAIGGLVGRILSVNIEQLVYSWLLIILGLGFEWFMLYKGRLLRQKMFGDVE